MQTILIYNPLYCFSIRLVNLTTYLYKKYKSVCNLAVSKRCTPELLKKDLTIDSLSYVNVRVDLFIIIHHKYSLKCIYLQFLKHPYWPYIFHTGNLFF